MLRGTVQNLLDRNLFLRLLLDPYCALKDTGCCDSPTPSTIILLMHRPNCIVSSPINNVDLIVVNFASNKLQEWNIFLIIFENVWFHLNYGDVPIPLSSFVTYILRLYNFWTNLSTQFLTRLIGHTLLFSDGDLREVVIIKLLLKLFSLCLLLFCHEFFLLYLNTWQVFIVNIIKTLRHLFEFIFTHICQLCDSYLESVVSFIVLLFNQVQGFFELF